jgi:acetyltransferase-like isoleucine patch superfamily enzyme
MRSVWRRTAITIPERLHDPTACSLALIEAGRPTRGRRGRGEAFRRRITRLLRGPFTVARLIVDRMCVPWRLSWLGLTIGRGCSFAGHPVVSLASGATITLGEGVHVLSRIDSNPAGLPHPTMLAAIGRDSYISIGDGTGISGASIVARAGVTIGRHVLIGAGACIWDTDFHPLDPHARREHQTRDAHFAPVQIEDDVFIGARALILKGVRIGWGAVIGAGAVVTQDVGKHQIAAGNPARIVGSVFPQRTTEER